MPTVFGIQSPEQTQRSSVEPLALPVPDGAFAKELTKRASLAQSPQRLEATRTHLSAREAAQALGGAWQQRFGQPASSGTLEVLVADWAHETGHGRAMMNYNFGGIKGTGPSGLSASYVTHEGSGATDRTVVDHFRAYRSAAEGASDYVGLLAQRFPKALDAARRGDAADFVRQLKQGGYFTGSEESYTHSVVSLANQARTLGFDALGTGPSAGTGDFPGASAPGIASASAANLIASGAAHLYASVDAPSVQTMARAGMLEMTDELSRAALRIAAAEPTHHDDE